ncbi:TonB-dependent receptor [Hahella sp. KA22]|uniref:TonB-dependent receptor plug domain-containing protein n=1 Tax=Hahella sp. KA22 TaxID=1628392 RepID=UPI000FDD9961|nr:TonB-dependent receptor [Hahella sp. KA22]AZZ91817.1 TonB-dependent receptor [Hahella sp. KA22]QAY55187.1 TonB-dependent receptor [Hahella sp. KA22]
MITTTRRFCALSLALAASAGYATDDNLFEDSLWALSPEELGQIRVTSIASGTITPLDKAAAVTTVITAEDIAAMGATDIDEVLETVPGLHVGRSFQAYFPIYTFRGISGSDYNPQALLLINGSPLTTLAFGNRYTIWGGMPVKSISRIEVIRGPGSALYGADAFAGVINVITKTGSEMEGTLAGTRAGSFDTYSAWLLHGGRIGDLQLGVTLEYMDTRGQKEEIKEDFMALIAPDDSLAPGEVNLGRQQAEVHMDMSYKDVTVRVGYQGRYGVETGAGVAQALDPEGEYASDRLTLEFLHTNRDWFENWEISTQLTYFFGRQKPTETSVIFPSTFVGAFPDRVLAEPGYKEEHARIQLSSIFRGWKDHRIRMGIGYFWGDLYETTEKKNFLSGLVPNPGGFEDFSDSDEVWLPEKDRTSYFLFLQDEWQFTQNWQLTSGVRYDHYSDFGETINPRIALVWATTDTLTTKLLYGRAFRAPSFVELYAISNPVSLGNPDLDPETINSYEFAVSYQPTAKLQYSGNLFYYKIDDFIVFEDSKAANAGNRKGRGWELEASYAVSDELKMTANYAYQRATDEETGKDVGDAPNYQAYGRIDYKIVPNTSVSTQINWIGEQKRADGDGRDPVSDYATVDFTVRRKALEERLEMALSVRNVFDREAYAPSTSRPMVAIPGDLPLEGRSLYGEVSYRF